MTVQADAGERELSRAESERMRCDAAVFDHGDRNTTTISPRVRREIRFAGVMTNEVVWFFRK